MEEEGFLFVIHTMVPLVLAVALIWSVTELYSAPVPSDLAFSCVKCFISPALCGKADFLRGREQGWVKGMFDHVPSTEGNKSLIPQGSQQLWSNHASLYPISDLAIYWDKCPRVARADAFLANKT